MEEGNKRGFREAEELKARYVIEGILEGERLHWTADHGPYFVTGDLHVGRNSCWVLDPGVLVCFVNPVSITMEAGSSLQAIGEKGKEIIFLSIREDLNPRFLFRGKEVQLDYVWQYAKLQGLPSYQKGGSGPAGGTIVHDAGSYENGWRYLEVDPRDLETFCQFGYCPEEEGLVTSLAFGSGKENTQALADMMKGGAYTYFEGNVTTFRYASRLALDHQVTREGNVYDDWFLPSMEEMERLQEDPEMMQELKDTSLWSSSEASRTQAWALVEGSWQKVMKGKSLQILPFRAF